MRTVALSCPVTGWTRHAVAACLLPVCCERCYPPHVDGRGVLCGAQEHVGGPVPQSHHLIGVGLCGNRLGSGQTWRTQEQVLGTADTTQTRLSRQLLSDGFRFAFSTGVELKRSLY